VPGSVEPDVLALKAERDSGCSAAASWATDPDGEQPGQAVAASPPIARVRDLGQQIGAAGSPR
jgi:hypothetical protein